MPFTLKTITSKIETVPNTVNRGLIAQFYENMKERDVSNNHKINNLKVVMSYAYYLGPETSFMKLTRGMKSCLSWIPRKGQSKAIQTRSGSLHGITTLTG